MKEMKWGMKIFFVSILICIKYLFSDVLVEAESFTNKGGWRLDHQGFEVIGSGYLIAHGIGTSVLNASTNVAFSELGIHHIYVRTRDWVSPYGPGQFQLRIDGNLYPVIHGKDGGGNWNWFYGGVIDVKNNTVTLELVDNTGFAARVDAINFSKTNNPPPNTLPEMRVWRNQLLNLPKDPLEEGFYDVVVVGGGISGIGAAVSSARMGLKVALIQNRPVLGGNNSSEIRVHLMGDYFNVPGDPYPNVGEIMYEINGPVTVGKPGDKEINPPEWYNDDVKEKIVRDEKNISLFLHHHVFEAEKNDNHIVSVTSRHLQNGTEHKFRGFLFVDATGDGNVGLLVGADHHFGREERSFSNETDAPINADSIHMGSTNYWWAKDQGGVSLWPNLPWAIQFDTSYYIDDFKAPDNGILRPRGAWRWESGYHMNTLLDAEQIRDHNFRATYGIWSFLKNTLGKYANYKLDFQAYIQGKRESNRLRGDVILNANDFHNKNICNDGAAITTWKIDVHYPTRENSLNYPGEEFYSYAAFTDIPHETLIPIRALYSRNISNLMMAGRNTSVTHVALGTTRVMGTGGVMGEAIGRTAHLVRKYLKTPRRIFHENLNELKVLLSNPAGSDGTVYPTPPSDLNNLFYQMADKVMDSEYDSPGIVITGDWIESSFSCQRSGVKYFHDNNDGKGQKSIKYYPNLPDGIYEVFVEGNPGAGRAGAVPVYVNTNKALSNHSINQQVSHWNSIGQFTFTKGMDDYVEISNVGTTGFVIADGVYFKAIDRKTPISGSPNSNIPILRYSLQKQKKLLKIHSNYSNDVEIYRYDISGNRIGNIISRRINPGESKIKLGVKGFKGMVIYSIRMRGSQKYYTGKFIQ